MSPHNFLLFHFRRHVRNTGLVLKQGTPECRNAGTPERRNTKTRNTKLLKPGTREK